MATWVQTSQFSKVMDAIKEKLATKLEASGVKNNATTTDAGYVLDARMGKTLGDRATTLETKVSDLYFATDSNGKWGYKSTKNGAVTPFRNPTGDAIAAEVLSGKIFSSAALENVAGTMANRGAWTGSTTGNGNVAIPEGYHNGSGYVSGAGAYNAGVTYADGRTNTNSANYKAGYNAGVTYADGRTNTKSANYKAGYSAGETAMTVEDVMVAVVHVNSSASFYSYASGYSAKGGRDNKGMTSCTGAMAGYNDGEITIVTAGKYIYFGSDGTWHTGTLSAGTVITYYAHSDGVRSCFAAKLKG